MNKAIELLPSAALVAYGYSTQDEISSFDFLIVCLVYVYVLSCSQERLSKVVLNGYAMWIIGYAIQIATCYWSKVGNWSNIAGAYDIQYEIIVAFTSFFDDQKGYHKPSYVVLGYSFYVFLDLVLCGQIVWYGNGGSYDAMGLLPTKTLEERVMTFGIYSLLSLIYIFSTSWLSSGRQHKYSLWGFYMVVHTSLLRMPAYGLLPTLNMSMKLQLFGNAFYVARFREPSRLPEPKSWVRMLILVMPMYCAYTATYGRMWITGLSDAELQQYTAAWMMLVWAGILVGSRMGVRQKRV